jgi:hypothetical protein
LVVRLAIIGADEDVDEGVAERLRLKWRIARVRIV